KRVSTGCSIRHSGHQLPQTLSRYGCPRSSSEDTRRPGSCSTGSSKSGAGLPIRGEGRAARLALPLSSAAANGSAPNRAQASGGRPADQGRGQGLAVVLATEQHACEQQRPQQREGDQRQPARERGTDGYGRRAHVVLSGADGGGGWRRAAPPVPPRGRRKRRSAAVTKPPSTISNAPAQIQRTKGLICIRSAQALSPRGSPSATNRSRVTPRSSAASVITWPPAT